MKKIVSLTIDNPMVVNLFAVATLIAGLFVVGATKKESFPVVTLDVVSVSVALPGASAEEVEEGVVIKVEEAIQGIAGVDYLQSSALEGVGTVSAVMRTDVKNPRKVLDDVKDRVDQIFTFPEDAEEPKVNLLENWTPSISVIVSGNQDERTLKTIAEEVRDEMLLEPEISRVDEAGVRPTEIAIEISEDNMKRYGIAFAEIAEAVRGYDFDLSGGVLRSSREEVGLRAVGKNYRPEEVENIMLRALPDGTKVRLRDVAEVKESFEEINYRLRYNGRPAVFLNVMKTDEDDDIKVTDAVKKYVKEKAKTLPDGVELTTWWDRSEFLKSRIFLLLKNAAISLPLIFISLLLFMGYRLAWWVAFGMPVAMMGTIVLLEFSSVTINMISLFAFILVMGILVDDAIVVGENVQQRLEKGESPREAAINGTAEVFPAVVASVLTTMLAFSPFFFIKGIWGSFLYAIPMVVILSLACSLAESLFVLPCHLSHSLLPIEEQKKARGPHWAVRRALDGAIQFLIRRMYRPTLKLAMKARWASFALGLGLFVVSLGVVASGRVRFIFFPAIESDYLVARYVLEPGSSMDVHQAAIDRIEEAVEKVNVEFTKKRDEFLKTPAGDAFAKKAGPGSPFVVQVVSTLGGNSGRGMGDSGVKGAETGEVMAELIDGELRGIRARDAVNRLRDLIGDPPGVARLNVSADIQMGSGSPIEIKLFGDDMKELIRSAELVKARLRAYAGVFDVQDDLAVGRREIVLGLNDKGKALGLTLRDLAVQVRQGFYGLEVHRIQRGKEEIKVWVRYPKEQRERVSDFESVMIRTRDGAEIPISEVATRKPGRQFRAIKRWDRMRTITVSCDVDTRQATPDDIKAELADSLPGVLAKTAGVKFKFEGEERDRGQMMEGLKTAFPVALVLIFLIIALTFRNYLHALLIMLIIPLGFVGAVVGHMCVPYINPKIQEMPLTMLSIWGIVGLAGIVVNDSIVMIDAIKRNIADGMDLFPAVLEGAVNRYRAIILTTLTTVAGMSTIILERSLQAQFLIPMATSVAFGLAVGTFFTLIWMPCAFLVFSDIKVAWYVMAKGRLYRPVDIERNALSEGSLIRGVIPAWSIALVALCGVGIVLALFWGLGPYAGIHV